MKTGINWSSTTRRFSMGSTPSALPKGTGRVRMIGSPMPVTDRWALWGILGTSLMALVLFSVINLFIGMMWLVALGPCSIGVAGMIGKMGGVWWQRGVATLYVVYLLLITAIFAANY